MGRDDQLDFNSTELQPIKRLVDATEQILPTIRQGGPVPMQAATQLEQAHQEVVRKFPNIQSGGRATSGVSESKR